MVDSGNGFKQFGTFPDDFSYWIVSSISEFTKDFWFVDGDPVIFFIVEPLIPQINSNYEAIAEFTLNATYGQILSQKILYTFEAGMYSGTKIIDYFPQQKILLLETSGGDGCGGWGVIWKLDQAGTRTDIQKYGGGCSINEKIPQYKGYLEHKLFFESMKYDATQLPPIPYSVDKVYSIDPLSLNKQFLELLPNELEKN